MMDEVKDILGFLDTNSSNRHLTKQSLRSCNDVNRQHLFASHVAGVLFSEPNIGI